jgi:hypothetical protein
MASILINIPITTLSELVEKYTSCGEFRKSIGSYTDLYNFVRQNHASLKIDVLRDFIETRYHYVKNDRNQKLVLSDKIIYHSAIYNFLFTTNGVDLLKHHYDETNDCFDSELDSAFYQNTDILYMILGTKYCLPYLKMVPKEYFSKINKIQQKNSRKATYSFCAPNGRNKRLNVQNLFCLPNDEKVILYLLENGVEPFNRQTKSIIAINEHGGNLGFYLHRYGIFEKLHKFYQLKLQDSTGPYKFVFKHDDTSLKSLYENNRCEKLFEIMFRYYAEKNDMDALDILSQVIGKLTIIPH